MRRLCRATPPAAQGQTAAAPSAAAEPADGGVDCDRVALADLALEELQGQDVHQLLLDHALQRAGAVCRVEPQVAEELAGLVAQLHLDAALG